MTDPDQWRAAESLVMGRLVESPRAEVAELVDLVRTVRPLLDSAELANRVGRLVDRARGLGAVGPLFNDPGISEVMVNGPGRVWIDRDGITEPSDVVLDETDISLLIERVLDPLGLRVDRSSPFVDARLPDGSRVNIVVPPLSLIGPVLTMRRFSAVPVGLDRFGPPIVQEILSRLVRGRATIVVVGGTGTGKTTLLNALGAHIGLFDRVITIEDTAELQLPGEHIVSLEARPPNREGVGEVTMRQLVRNALRMRPDRLVIGEVRGGEALDLLLALNTGHQGSLTTCHGNGPRAGLRRLETLALLGGVDLPLTAIREQMLEAIDVLVHVGRRDGNRQVLAIAEVDTDQTATRELWPMTESSPRRLIVRRALSAC